MKKDEIPEYLFVELPKFYTDLPDQIVHVPKMVETTAFFPGGRGLWLKENDVSTPVSTPLDVMVLGQDFSTEDQHKSILAGETQDMDTPTWKNFRKIAKEVGLDLNRCFFSNVMMGLRRGKSSIGLFPGFTDETYMKNNDAFLQLQFDTLTPKLVIVLGSVAPKVLARIGKGSGIDVWCNFNFKNVDQKQRGLIENISFGTVTTNLVALIHPSMRRLNLRHRTYNHLIGHDAEIALLRDAMKKSHI